MIVVVCGLPGVGKTTLAKEIAPMIKATILSTDKIRKELLSQPTYQQQERILIYDIMVIIAKYLHDAGINCILDATFNKETSRNELIEKLGLSKDQIKIFECICPEAVVISRIKARKNDYSDADVSVYNKMKKIYEPVKGEHLTVDTSKDVKSSTQFVVDQILEIK